MHNIKEIRKDFSVFAQSLEKRSVNIDFKNWLSTIPTLANKLKTTGNWKLKPNAKISFITRDKYSLTLASSWIGRLVESPVLSNDKKNLIASGIMR